MDNPVVFNYANWAARYPEFSYVSQPSAQMYFNEAQLYCDNTPCSIIPNCQPIYLRTTLLNQVTAHIAFLNAPTQSGGQQVAASPLVGRISNATEGSVNVTTEMNYPAGSSQWFLQTKYGAAFWAATTQFRSMLYAPGPVPRANPYFPFTIVNPASR